MTTRNHPIEAEELMAYLDGELAFDQAAAATTHLEDCMQCQQLAADLRGLSQTLNTWELQPANSTLPKSLAAVLEERTAESQPTFGVPLPWYRRQWLGGWALATSGIAAIVIVSFVSFVGRNSNTVYSQVGSIVDDSARADQSPPPAAGPVRALNSPARSTDSKALFHSNRAENSFSVDGQPATDQQSKVVGGIAAKVATGDQPQQSAAAAISSPTATTNLLPTGPMIIRTAELSLTTREFDKGRAQVEDILKRHHGYVGSLNVTAAAGTGRTLTASLRIPSTQLDAALTELKALGRLVSESKTGQEVTAQYVDLQARLANSRNTEQRLTELLRDRTGKLSDLLEVENELARVRGEVESMEAERKSLSNQVDFATLNLTLTEDYRAQLQVVPPSTSTRLSNAAVEGYRSMVDGLMSIALFFLSSGPTLLLWTAILILPASLVWKKLRRSFAQ